MMYAVSENPAATLYASKELAPMPDAVRPFSAMPTIEIPSDYAVVYPQFLARMAEMHGPVYRRRVRGMTAHGAPWIVYMVGPEANKFVLHTERDAFSHNLGWTPILSTYFERGLLNTDDPQHARDRKIMNPAFTLAYMERYLPIMQRVIAERTRQWVERGVVDLSIEARKITFDVAAEALMGFKTGREVDTMRRIFAALLRADMQPDPSEEAIEYELDDNLVDTLNRMILEQIAERRRAPTDDMLGRLVIARDENGEGFTDQELLGQTQILLVAGHETTTTLSAWLLYLLAAHPDVLARVRAEVDAVLAASDGTVGLEQLRAMTTLGYAINEANRLRGPVGSAPRGTTRPVAFGGYAIPAGSRILLSYVACHHMARYFPDPETFDIDRFAPPREEDKRIPYAYAPFGAGPRVCIGMNFATVEVKALVTHVLSHLDLAYASGSEPINVYYGPVASIYGGMPMRFTPRTR
jgi:cytochrome P450